MPGIVAYGAYVPFSRLQRSTIAEALQTRPAKGERAVAGYDEDTATMAVEASRTALENFDAASISSLYFATTDPPYQEKLNAATVHAALGLSPSVRALDLGGSVRSGVTAFLAANDATVHAGPILATMSDIRLGAPEGAAEQGGGDAAAAFVLGTENVIAEVEASYSETLEHLATWRLPGEKFSKSWEERFSLTQIYTPLLMRGAKALLEKAGLQPGNIDAYIIDAPSVRAVAGLAKTLDVPPESHADAFLESVGHTGCAHAGLMLAAALDKAKPGDRIFVISVSDGVDAFVVRATDAIADYNNSKPVRSLVESCRNDLAYTRYLKWRGIIETERPRRPDPSRPAGPPAFRARRWKFGLVGSECTECGTRHLPPQSVCVSCGAAEKMRDVPYANLRAKVKTYTLDRLASTPQPPMVSAILDFDEGGRVEMEITDCEPEKVAIGDEVEMTFRRLFTADGVHNYFWKSRPIR